MARKSDKRCLLLVAAAIVACAAVSASAQSRKALQSQSVGYGLGVGRSGSHDFRGYSFGVGSLRNSKGSATGVLSSKISSSANFNISRSASGVAAPKSSGIGRSPIPSAPRAGVRSGSGISDAVAKIGSGSAAKLPKGFAAKSGSVDLLLAINPQDMLQDAVGGEMITSFVPDAPSKYQKYLKAGERRFREGSYTKAFNEFRLANYIGRNDPESLLSMSHAQFALGHFSSASHYLKKAIKYFPELPVLPLRPRGFYSNPDDYATDINALRQHIKSSPNDTSALLLLLYHRWFDGEYADAKGALERAEQIAMEGAGASENFEIIEIFRRGMIASGKISFEETPASQPEQGKTEQTDKTPPTENQDLDLIEEG